MATWRIVNLVATVVLNVKIPVDKLLDLEDITYDPEQFPGANLKLKTKSSNNVSILIFTTGKLVISGLKTKEDFEDTIEKLRELFKEKLGIEIPKNVEYRIQNFVANGQFKYNNIDISKLAEEEDATYNPEQFPGVPIKYKTKSGEVTFLVYKNGKFVLTGAKSFDEAEEAIDEFEKKIAKYAKQ